MLLQGVSKKNSTLGITIISLAMNMLGGWDLFYLEGKIHSFVSSTKIMRRTPRSERKQVFASNSKFQIEIVRNIACDK